MSQRDKEYYLKNREKIRARANLRYKLKHAEILAYQAKYRKECADKIRAYKLKSREHDLKRNAAYKRARKNEGKFLEGKRRAAKLQRTPKWANIPTIRLIYKLCPEGYNVDHYYPLQGEFVSGLNVENNLQYLTPTENFKKATKTPGIDWPEWSNPHEK